MSSNFLWLQQWYASQCDDDWEHQFGVLIRTIDNPGWQLQIDMEGTELLELAFEPKTLERSEENWLHCWVADHKFQAACGAENLDEAIGLFREWAVSSVSHDS